MSSGRLDIAVHTLISAFFLSHSFREDVKLHLVFDGSPDPTKHFELKPDIHAKDKIYLSKKDIAWVLKRMLYKYKEGERTEVFPGYFISKKPLLIVLRDLLKEGKTLYILDAKGDSIRDEKLDENSVFIIGDHQGLPSLSTKELKRYKSQIKYVSIGDKMYFASQTLTILNHELDMRETASKK